jgi:hypothetical protein
MTQIKWSNKPNIQTLNDAYATWNDYYRDNINSKFIETFDDFLKIYECCGVMKNVNMSSLDNIENSRHKINGKTPEEYYPKKNRPRGEKDIESVKYYIRTKKYVSPIVIINIDNRRIKLDGVHRIIAAKLRKSKIRICEIIIPKI